MKFLLPFFSCILVLFSCSETDLSRLKQDNLFVLEFGESEKQINVFLSDVLSQKNRIAMHEGQFYIANGQSSKVMLFNSYGDLLSLIYNPEKNPNPTALAVRGDDEKTVATLTAHPYLFRSVGEIALDSRQILMVEELVSPQQTLYDEENNTMLNRVITRFSRRMEVLDYLGQEGIGGTPFPYIHSLEITKHDQIIVVSRTLDEWMVFGYSPNGERLFRVLLFLNQLPTPDRNLVPVLNNVVPSRDGKALYVLLAYYQMQRDSDTGAAFAVDFMMERIYTLDLQQERYVDFFDIPRVSTTPYEFIGISDSNHFFLLQSSTPNDTEVLVLDEAGELHLRRSLSHQSFLFRDFSLTPQGHLSSLLVHNEGVDIVVWTFNVE